MFYNYFGLREQPFGVTPDPRFLFSSEPHREALASLIYGIESQLGFSSLIGDPGLGKTTLLNALLERYASTSRTAFLFSGDWHSRELVRLILSDFEVEVATDDLDAMLRAFRDMLLTEARSNRRVILVLDEAQALSPSSLEAVRLLSNFEAPDSKLLHVIIAGQSQLSDLLSDPALASLQQRIATPVRLRPLFAEECAQYIEHRLRMAGAGQARIFTPDAVTVIFEHSKGVPRLINRICMNAMGLAYALEQKQVNEKIVLDVLKDLSPESELQPVPPTPVVTPRAETPPLPVQRISADPVPISQTTLTWGSQALAIAPSIKTPMPEETPVPEEAAAAIEPPPLRAPIDIGERLRELRSDVRYETSPERRASVNVRRALLMTSGFLVLGLCVAAGIFFTVRLAKTDGQHHDQAVSEETLPPAAEPPAPPPDMSPAPSPSAAKPNHGSMAVTSTRGIPASSAGSQWHSTPPIVAGTNHGPRLKSVSTVADVEKPSAPSETHLAVGSASNAAAVHGGGISIRGAAPTPSAIPQITPPVLKVRVDPVFPKTMQQQDLRGNVKMRLHLDKRGLVVGIVVLSGDNRLAGPAEAAVRHWVFSPFQQNGEPVEGNTTVNLSFASD